MEGDTGLREFLNSLADRLTAIEGLIRTNHNQPPHPRPPLLPEPIQPPRQTTDHIPPLLPNLGQWAKGPPHNQHWPPLTIHKRTVPDHNRPPPLTKRPPEPNGGPWQGRTWVNGNRYPKKDQPDRPLHRPGTNPTWTNSFSHLNAPDRQPRDNQTGQPRHRIDTNNRQFGELVKGLYRSCQLRHHAGNWKSVPQTLERQLTDMFRKLSPPMPDQEFRRTTDGLLRALLTDYQRLVTEHIERKLESNRNSLRTLDKTDLEEAKRLTLRNLHRNLPKADQTKLNDWMTQDLRTTRTMPPSTAKTVTRPPSPVSPPPRGHMAPSTTSGPPTSPDPRATPDLPVPPPTLPLPTEHTTPDQRGPPQRMDTDGLDPELQGYFLPQRRLKRPRQQTPPEAESSSIPTENRFQILEIKEHTPTLPPPKRIHSASPNTEDIPGLAPDEVESTDSELIQATCDIELQLSNTIQRTTPNPQQPSIPTEPTPRTPDHITIEDDLFDSDASTIDLIPLLSTVPVVPVAHPPTPPTIPSTQPTGPRRLSLPGNLDRTPNTARNPKVIVHPNTNDKQHWKLRMMDNVTTLIVTDSNFRHAEGLQIPVNWEIQVFPGAKIGHVTKLLDDATLRPSLRQIVVAVGINNRAWAWKSSAEYEIAKLNTAFNRRRGIKHFFLGVSAKDLDQRTMNNIRDLNQGARDRFQGRFIKPLPTDQVTVTADSIHYDVHTVAKLIESIKAHLALN